MVEGKILTGSADLDKWLAGGYDKDIITTIYGPAGCGKTNFCITAAINAAKNGGKVIFIDTEGGFSVERFKQISKGEPEELLKNILLLKPTNFIEQKNAFLRLLKEIKESTTIRLVIVDGMTMLYRLELAEARRSNNQEKIEEINSMLARQMRILAEVSRKRDIPVIATNQVYYGFLNEEDVKAGKERGVSMVGGDIMRYWSKCIIELKHSHGKRVAVLKKHRSLAETELNFEITSEGIRKKGWL